MQKLRDSSFKANFVPFVFVFLITCLIFFKIFLKGFYPVPADLLVSFYFPWYSGGWPGYNSFTTHKEMLNADSIRQIYLWKEFAANQFKAGHFPLWNPYTFSGQPLAANFQSSVYYPFNIFYFLTSPQNAWILLIVIQPLLGGIFMYLAIKSFKVSKLASLFGATAFMFSSYLVTWMENGNVIHSYIWLPLTFWAINNYFDNFKKRFLIVFTAALVLSVLAGHPQTAIYIYLTVFLFWIFKMRKNHAWDLLNLIVVFATSFLLSAVQLIPTLQFYKESPISLPFSVYAFDLQIVPYHNLITFFASDFFGHPANNNFWSKSYGDLTPYFGVIPLIFALWAIYKFWQKTNVKFLSIVSGIFIIAAVHSPITFLIKTFRLPILDSTTPSRFISISIFLLIILSAIGFGDFILNFKVKNYLKKFLKFLIPFGFLYLLFWIFALFASKFLKPADIWQLNLAVTRRNLILPTLMFLSFPFTAFFLILVPRIAKTKSNLITATPILIFFLTILIGGVYYSNKFLAFAPKNFIFPDHPIFTWLRQNAGIYRSYGNGTGHVDFNFPTHYQIYGSEGYDTLRLERYAQLLAAAKNNGKVPKFYLRSDAVFPESENDYRKRLFELLGVKYLTDKNDTPKSAADWQYDRFNGDNVKGVWQEGKFQIYQREKVLPRVFLTTNFQVEKDDSRIIDDIFNPQYDLQNLILEQQPAITITGQKPGIIEPVIIKYEPNQTIFETNANYNSLLFLSDAYDTDWHAYIDSTRSNIMRTDYALRSVAVPAGNHRVTFRYEPKSQVYGIATTSLSLVAAIAAVFYWQRKKEF